MSEYPPRLLLNSARCLPAEVLQNPHAHERRRADALPVSVLAERTERIVVKPDSEPLRQGCGEAHGSGCEFVPVFGDIMGIPECSLCFAAGKFWYPTCSVLLCHAATPPSFSL